MALHNKLAVITGCSSGIGLATTQLFLRAGATVFGIDISAFPSPSPLPASSAAQFHFHQADLSKPTAAQEAIEACRATAGRPVDVLANVAGIMDNFEGADIVTDELWERVMNVNATAPMRLIRAVLTQGGMKERRSGTIVNVASKAALGGGATGVAYTASKHALVRWLWLYIPAYLDRNRSV
jgi:NAD(P)-dependent dehydrogenase (short-subunit alcohol dehydrogenase family)